MLFIFPVAFILVTFFSEDFGFISNDVGGLELRKSLISFFYICAVTLQAFFILHIVFFAKFLTFPAKILWVVLIIFGNMFAIPIYWYKYLK